MPWVESSVVGSDRVQQESTGANEDEEVPLVRREVRRKREW
jgi:hypothetical protein